MSPGYVGVCDWRQISLFPCFELSGLNFTCADGAWSTYFCQNMAIFYQVQYSQNKYTADLVSLDQFAQPMNSFNGYPIPSFPAVVGNCSTVPFFF